MPIKRIAKQLGLLQKTVRAGLLPRAGTPAQSPILRYCLRCLRRGYHGVVHQRLGADQCPIHGDWLEEVCTSCDQRMDYQLNASLLDAPFRCKHCRRALGRWDCSTHKPLSRIDRIAVTRAFINRHNRRTAERAKYDDPKWRAMDRKGWR